MDRRARIRATLIAACLLTVGLACAALAAKTSTPDLAPAPTSPRDAPRSTQGPSQDGSTRSGLPADACPARLIPTTIRGTEDASASRLVHQTSNKTVELDESMALAVVALASATNTPIPFDAVSNYTIVRIEVCEFELATQARSMKRVIAVETRIQHNATLDASTVLRAIAMNSTGTPLSPLDVITFSHHEETIRRYDQTVERHADSISIALAGAQATALPADPPAELAAAAHTPDPAPRSDARGEHPPPDDDPQPTSPSPTARADDIETATNESSPPSPEDASETHGPRPGLLTLLGAL